MTDRAVTWHMPLALNEAWAVPCVGGGPQD